MGQTATTISEQIGKLKDRGMELDLPIEKVEEILFDIGYYRLGFYWHPFEIDAKHNFKPGTKFSDCVQLYYFDNDLRQLLVKYTNRIEINFRTKLVFEVSIKYYTNPVWFVNSKYVKGHFISGFKDIYLKLREENKFLKRHHQKHPTHKFAPAWKTIEFLTFGSVFNMYKALKNEALKTKISAHYGLKKHYKLHNYLGLTLFVRNACAHGAVIFDLNTPLEIEKLPTIQFNNDDRHSLDSAIKVIHYLLSQISINRAKDFLNEIEDLIAKRINTSSLNEVICLKMNYIKQNK
jgi:abortive infection bacteriophage resistance protein